MNATTYSTRAASYFDGPSRSPCYLLNGLPRELMEMAELVIPKTHTDKDRYYTRRECIEESSELGDCICFWVVPPVVDSAFPGPNPDVVDKAWHIYRRNRNCRRDARNSVYALLGLTAKYAGHAGKTLREPETTARRYTEMSAVATEMTPHFVLVANYLGRSLDEVAYEHIQKMERRKAAGTINGDGNR